MIEVYDPGNGELLGTVPSASREDVEQVLATASKASTIARDMPTHLRISVLRQVAEQLLKRHEEFAQVIAKEGIKTIRQARKEVSRCIEALRISAEEARRLAGETINDSSDYRMDAMPFGGTRGSGLGREGVAHAIHAMTDLKTYCFNL